MHLTDQLLSARVYLPAAAAAVAGLSFCASRIRRGGPDEGRQEIGDGSIAVMGVLGAFIFAAQMINFPVLPGTTGHLGGGVLLAILFGPYHASILMASILMVQCLIFQDGGILALGANIINMGIIPCFLGYGIYQVVAASPLPRKSAPFLAAWFGMLGGAFVVPFMVCGSGVTGIPLQGFLFVMLGIHALIGAAEGLITLAVLEYIRKLYPHRSFGEPAPGTRGFVIVVLVAALVVGGGLSTVAADDPDGLERAAQVCGFSGGDGGGEETAGFAPMPDYNVPGIHSGFSVALAGIAGTVATFLFVFLVTRITGRKR